MSRLTRFRAWRRTLELRARATRDRRRLADGAPPDVVERADARLADAKAAERRAWKSFNAAFAGRLTDGSDR